ncbi:MAG: heparan-alpha-glucosaminide N-acetyltransferase domain-containing protein [Flammeovirgaceae bacterium]|nr:heparan-alpha-glucosaminide N-acetyltransferase domain-containing protein [Flammeovirgaceae bacterium]
MIPTELNIKPRISSIDIMRGVVMVIMALDHVRDFFHADATLFDPTDMTKTNPALFATRWVTHFCAPTFVFLSGVSACISLQRKSKKELSLHLFTRGLWLIILEQTLFRFGLLFTWKYDMLIFLVLWAIGGSMIILAALVYFSPRIILSMGLILIFGHNAFDTMRLVPGDTGYAIWAFLMQSGFVPPGSVVPYALIPWLGIMLAGFGAGNLYFNSIDPSQRRKILFNAGLSAVGLFIILRAINVYGDLAPWTVQKNSLFTVMSFMNVTKYPVSLLFTLATLGPVLMILAWMERSNSTVLERVSVFGRVPLFYYVLHFYLIHAGALGLFMLSTGTSFSELDFSFNTGFGGIPRGFGYTLDWTYVAWFGTVMIMYPLCVWYNRYKSTHRY